MHKLACAITKCTKSCDKRLVRLISYIYHTSEYRQHCYVGNTAPQCRLGLFQDSHFAGDLEGSKSTSGGTVCIFGSRTFVPISWMCKKQTAVSHSSTESEIISLDTGLRLDGLLALELWDLIVSVLGHVSRVSDRSGKPECDIHKHHKSHKKIDVIKHIDAVPSNVQSARQEALLYVFEETVLQKLTSIFSMQVCAWTVFPLTLWDLVIEVFHSAPIRIDGPKREPWRNPSAGVKPNMHDPIPIKHTNVIPTKHCSHSIK